MVPARPTDALGQLPVVEQAADSGAQGLVVAGLHEQPRGAGIPASMASITDSGMASRSLGSTNASSPAIQLRASSIHPVMWSRSVIPRVAATRSR